MTLSCGTVERLLGRMAEGGIPAAVRRRIEAHLASCPECRLLAEAHRTVVDSLLAAEPVEHPGLAERLLFMTGELVTDRETLAINCQRVSTLAAAFADGTLDDALASCIQGHRAACPDCDRLIAAHETIRTVFESTRPLEAPDGLTARILSLTEAERSLPLSIRFRAAVRRYSAPAAALALGSGLIAAAGLRLFQGTVHGTMAVPDFSVLSNLAAAQMLGFLAVHAPGLVSDWYRIADATGLDLSLLALAVLALAGGMLHYYAAPVLPSPAARIASPPERYGRFAGDQRAR